MPPDYKGHPTPDASIDWSQTEHHLERGVGDGDLHLDSGLDGDGRDLLDDLRGGVQVQDALVDAHLEAVPGVGSLSAGRLAGHDLELLGGQAHGPGHLELLLDRSLLQVRAHCGGYTIVTVVTQELDDVQAARRQRSQLHKCCRQSHSSRCSCTTAVRELPSS